MAFKQIIKRFFLFSLMTFAGLLLPYNAKAGFEWVPMQKEAAPVQKVEQPVYVEEIQIEADSQNDSKMMTPMPLDESQDMQASAKDSSMMRPAPEPVMMNMTDDEPAAPSKVKMIDMSDKSKAMAPKTEMETVEPMAEPMMKTKVIMPQDAPQTAQDNVPDSEKLEISAFPKATMIDTKPSMDEQPHKAEAMNNDKMTDEAAQKTPIMGFGSDIPLAIALRQIAPPNYTFSFAPEVNAGAKVSWNGGDAWEMVVHDMLSPLRLTAIIRNNIIHIKQRPPLHASTMTETSDVKSESMILIDDENDQDSIDKAPEASSEAMEK